MENLVKQLRRLAIERRPEACLGCGFEYGCSVHGCAVIKRAAEMVEAYTPHTHGKPAVVSFTCPLCKNKVEAMWKDIPTCRDNGQYYIRCPRCWGEIGLPPELSELLIQKCDGMERMQ